MTVEPSTSRRSWPFLVAVAAVLALVPVSYWYFLGRSPPPAPVAAPEKPVDLKIGELQGQVQVRRGEGTWSVAARGDALHPSDSVRTETGATALLVGGEAYEVRMESGTQVSVGELTHSISKLMLQSGMATATVHGAAKHSFEVRAAGSDAVARTGDGTFAISNNGQGTVAVGTLEGQVELVAQGRAVLVRSGQRSTVLPHQAPSDPTAIPSSLLLKVQWPAQSAINHRRLEVVGHSEPGAQVEVAGRAVLVDDRGNFSTRVDLSEGRNVLNVKAMAVGNLVKDDHHSIYVETKADKIQLDRNLWKR